MKESIDDNSSCCQTSLSKGQCAFIKSLLPELFHDLRSPLSSVMSFFYIIDNIKETDDFKSFTQEALDEERKTLKRIDALEELFSSLFCSHWENHPSKVFSEIIQWLFVVFDSKIKRNRVSVKTTGIIELPSDKIILNAGALRIILLELFYKILSKPASYSKILIENSFKNGLVFLTFWLQGEAKDCSKLHESRFDLVCTSAGINAYQYEDVCIKVLINVYKAVDDVLIVM